MQNSAKKGKAGSSTRLYKWILLTVILPIDYPRFRPKYKKRAPESQALFRNRGQKMTLNRR
jgi:hypothetical protein